MIGKFINPIVSSSAPPTPTDAGIYLFGRMQVGVYGSNCATFNNIAILNSDLTIDTSFNPGTGLVGSQPRFNKMIELSDGKLLASAFSSTSYNGVTIGGIVKLNLDGSVDTSFLSGTGFNNSVIPLTLQSDGKILLGGSFTLYNGTSINRIVRLNTDGTIDSSFVVGTGFNGTVNDIKIQPDGKIVIVGSFTTYNSTTANRIIRLNTDGSIDSSFNTGTGASGDLNYISLRADGSMYIASSNSLNITYNGISTLRLFRINSDGTRDTSFTSAVTYLSSNINDMIATDDGGVITVGLMGSTTSFASNYGSIYKHTSTGARDTTFLMTGARNASNIQSINCISLDVSNKYLLAGYFYNFNGQVSRKFVRINQNGSIDTVSPFFLQDFSTSSSTFNKIETIIRLSTGKIVIAGWRQFISNIDTNIFTRGVVKLSSYNTIIKENQNLGLTGLLNTDLFTIKSLYNPSDNSIIINDTTTNNAIYSYFRKIDSDLDTIKSFNQNNYVEGGYVYNIIKLSNGGYFLVGAFNTYQAIRRERIVRTDANFNIDLSFNPPTSITSVVYKAIEQSDGKVIIVGEFTNPQSRILRFNLNGSVDSTFTASFSNSGAVDIVEQSDGKLIVAGGFTEGIRRINSTNGSTDSSFVTGTGFDLIAITLHIQPDGKILVGGLFTSYNGTASNRIIRLNTDGSVDNTFSIGTGFDGRVLDINMDSSGKIYVGGDFNSYNGIPALKYCVLESDGTFVPTNILFNDRVDSILIIE
jgi:uncharacterized delta-60 repeat protein